MKRFSWLLVAVLALVLAAPAMAGEGYGKKCKQSAEACLVYYSEKLDSYGWVGIELDRDEETGVMTVTQVIEDSPAMKSGLKKGDILFALNGVHLNEENKEKLKTAKGDWAPGNEVAYTVKRNDKKVKVALTLGEMPRDVLAQMIGNHMLSSHMELASNE